ncbi:MAG: glycogen/starch synthase [Bacteroidales bacterium]|nr:glycogen/starch synthase [Bacteroidales bacterium]
MKEAQKILYVTQEMEPYLPESPMATLCRRMPQKTQEDGREMRAFMPRFGCINERRNQLHEVIRLSGMNMIIDDTDHSLIIKVASIQSARMQVYFIDNEEYFTNHKGFFDDKGKFCADNDERILFYGRGTLEAVRKLAWQPHLIHFTGWFSCMIPFYLRRINKENAFFSGTKTVFSITNDGFEGKFGPDMERKLKADGATAKDLRLFENLDYMTLTKAAITYAHGIVIASPNANPELVAFARENKRNIVEYNEDRTVFYEQINKMYDSIIGSNINN